MHSLSIKSLAVSVDTIVVPLRPTDSTLTLGVAKRSGKAACITSIRALSLNSSLPIAVSKSIAVMSSLSAFPVAVFSGACTVWTVSVGIVDTQTTGVCFAFSFVMSVAAPNIVFQSASSPCFTTACKALRK